MLNGNVHLLVEDIESLLKDICEFLSQNVNDGFSGQQKLLAEKLINRSKSQLQTITKYTATLAEPDTSYVDMTRKVPSDTKEETKEIDLEEEYSAVDDQQITRHCPYKCKSASEVKENKQWGYLERKKSLWFLGHQIRMFGVATDGWLLLYNSEKDNKPVDYLDLEMYVVKYCDSKDSKCKKEMKTFEVISATKTYQFIAKNSKDADQWVTALSKTAKTLPDENNIEESVEFKPPNKPKMFMKELPPLPQSPSIPNPYILRPSRDKSDEPVDTYDAVCVVSDKDDIDDGIYECPDLMNKPSKREQTHVTKQQEQPPPLPPPLHTTSKSFLYSARKKSVPAIPQMNENEEDDEVEYDLPLIEKQKKSIESESEEEYDEVVTLSSKKPQMKPNIQQLKLTPPKILPKPMFAGINRGGSVTKR